MDDYEWAKDLQIGHNRLISHAFRKVRTFIMVPLTAPINTVAITTFRFLKEKWLFADISAGIFIVYTGEWRNASLLDVIKKEVSKKILTT